ncbi:MAG: hypothetical protein OXE99_03265 [Cellvibrionales bacterium]|nr:hypothetical protein [Cellvibrionales bacterium]
MSFISDVLDKLMMQNSNGCKENLELRDGEEIRQLISDCLISDNSQLTYSNKLSLIKTYILAIKDEEEIALGDYALFRPNQGSKKLLIVFSGGSAPKKSFHFYKQLSEFSENILFLNTTFELYYHLGIPNLGDGFDDALDTIRLIEQLIDENCQTYTFGVSQGGWGALLYGTYLNAQNIFAMGPRHPDFTPALYDLDNRENLVNEAYKLTPKIFNSSVKKIILYGDHSWHDLQSYIFYSDLINSKLVVYTNMPHNIAIHLVNSNKLVQSLINLVFGRSVSLHRDENDIVRNSKLITTIFNEIYSFSPSLDLKAVYSVVKDVIHTLPERQVYLIRMALGDLHRDLDDDLPSLGNYKLSISSTISLPALKNALKLLEKYGSYDELISYFIENYDVINYQDQERDEVGLLFLYFFRALFRLEKFDVFQEYHEILLTKCRWAFTYPKLDSLISEMALKNTESAV